MKGDLSNVKLLFYLVCGTHYRFRSALENLTSSIVCKYFTCSLDLVLLLFHNDALTFYFHNK